MKSRILVWDWPTRLFHWLLAVSFAGAFLTGESERWRAIHVLLGYTVLGLILFRLVWGFAGTRYARFSDFVRGPIVIKRYLVSLLSGRPEHHVGHNPAGAIAIVLLLLLGIASGLSGWMVYEELGGEWLEELHEAISNAMLAVVVIHIIGVAISSRLHKENLALAMVTGRKQGEAQQAISGSRPLVGWLLLAVLIGLWGWAWSKGPGVGGQTDGQTAVTGSQREPVGEDDD